MGTVLVRPVRLTLGVQRTLSWLVPCQCLHPAPSTDVVYLQLTDGFCGSTCAIFAELMKTDAGVRRVAMGGVPSISGPMQAVSGSRGSQVYGK